MSRPRELVAAVGLCLLGSAVILLAVSRDWFVYRFGAAPPLPSRQVSVGGSELAPGARALGLLGLAGVAVLVATRGLARVLVGVLLTGAGAGAVVAVVRVLHDPSGPLARVVPVDAHLSDAQHLGGWPYVAIAGALLLSAAGLLVVLRGRRWSAMSSRYDAPEVKPAGESSVWEALDRGEDPTKASSESGG